MSDHDYQDFELVLEQKEGADGTYVAEVARSPAGRASSDFTLPFEPLELENFSLKLGHRRGMRRIESSQTSEARAVGTKLFDAVFTGDIALAYERSKARTGAGLRIRLRVEDQELAGIPWEFLFDTDRDQFLVLSKQTPLVRMLDLPPFQLRPNAIELPLRVLVMVSRPSDVETLDVEAEYNRLAEAMQDRIDSGHIELERASGSLGELQRLLRKDDYHIFHFIGHGGYDTANDDGVLMLEADNGTAELVPGSKLGTILHDKESLQLVLLNACEGARGSDEDPFAGVAQGLIRKGMPAVIAMQYEISDTAAIRLAHDFYAALSDQFPVDAALAEARKAVFVSSQDVEWATPVLYLQNESGQIFDIATPLPPPTFDTAPDAATPPQIQPVSAPPPAAQPPEQSRGQAISAPEVATAAAPPTPPAAEHAPPATPAAPPTPPAAEQPPPGAPPEQAAAQPMPSPDTPVAQPVPGDTPKKRWSTGAKIGAGAAGLVVAFIILGLIGMALPDETQPEPEVASATVVAPVEDEPVVAAPTEQPQVEEPTTQATEIISNRIFVPRINDAPASFGLGDRWDDIDYHTSRSVVYFNDWDGQRSINDSWASFTFAHDNDFLYALVEIRDDVHDQINTGANIFRGDAVNFNFASAQSANSSGPQPGDVQLTLAMSDEDGAVLNWWNGDGRSFGESLGDLGVVDFLVLDADGLGFEGSHYFVEARIPKSTLPDDVGLILASVNDSDGEHAQTVVFGHLADDDISRPGDNTLFQSPNRWGQLVLE